MCDAGEGDTAADARPCALSRPVGPEAALRESDPEKNWTSPVTVRYARASSAVNTSVGLAGQHMRAREREYLNVRRYHKPSARV